MHILAFLKKSGLVTSTRAGIILALFVFSLSAQPLDMKLLPGIKARSIGPAGMSGRVTSIDVVLRNPDIIYIGTASGGVWRSESGGTDWQPIFDDQPLASIGAVTVDQNIPDNIWVGTGEGNPRNSQSSGNGIYRSVDGGRSWQHLGLEQTRNIHRIIVDPRNSDVVYVAALGSAWGEGARRGVFKTSDGGKSWQRVLFVNEKTGCAELVMDPANPKKLIAAMWEYRRWPWFFKSGGPGSGIYVTFDGGASWQKRTSDDGLPEGDLGRIGLAIAHNQPRRVYALVEAKKNALYRSDDGGFRWTKVSDKNIGNRPFYYAEIYVDPSNENRIYNLYSVVTVSEDGGRTFRDLIPWSKIHPDHHAWWIHPDNPDFIIDGNDGGMAISRDRGKTWRFVSNLPLAQFYHINYDMEQPYNVYGGMQDNGSWRGPSQVYKRGGIRNSYWQEVSFGDGFDVVPDSADARYGYSMSQGGWVNRYDLVTGYLRNIRPYHPDGIELRFNWNAAIAHDPFEKNTIYFGSQFLHKSTDRGNSWEIISPDLTSNDPQKQKQMDSGGLSYDVTDAENYTTIISIAPSPVKAGVIWVGTDDGNVQLTRDGGKNWTNLIGNMKGAPKNGWVAQIHASTYDAGEAFVVINNYRQDDWKPYVFHTTNFGKSWRNIADGQQVFGYALSFVQDPLAAGLYFLGTESGLYVSLDAAESWSKWTRGYPTVSTMDLKIHPREHDLIIGTFGRAAYIIDNIQPLRELALNGNKLMQQDLHLFPVPAARENIYMQAPGTRFVGEAEFRGQNKPGGAMISYWARVKAGPKKSAESDSGAAQNEDVFRDSVKVRIYNESDELIRTLIHKPQNGLNRIYWDLREKGLRFPNQARPKKDAQEPSGVQVLPGDYKLVIHYRNASDSAHVTVRSDARISVDPAILAKRRQLAKPLLKMIAKSTGAADRLREIAKQVGQVNERIADMDSAGLADLKKAGQAVQDSARALLERINQKKVQGLRFDDTVLSSRLRYAYRTILSEYDRPGQREELALQQAEKAYNGLMPAIRSFFEKDWAGYVDKVRRAEISLLKEYREF